MDETLRIMEDLNLLYIRQMALSLQDSEFQEKIDRELRVRDGACRLLAACTQREQALEAAKSLLVCNARITSCMSQVQRMKERQVIPRRVRRSSDAALLDDRLPCKGTVSVSDLRIPLMWKDTDYFQNRGDGHRYAVFGLMQVGCDIYDTEMVIVDHTVTDICFESAVVFASVGPEFEVKLEIYSCCVDDDFSVSSGPRSLASKLSSSLGRSTGKRIRAGLNAAGDSPSNGAANAILLPASPVGGPKYHLLAHTSLTLTDVHSGVRTHGLNLVDREDPWSWLPLYGSVCCRLAAQPHCMTHTLITSYLNLQQRVGQLPGRSRLWCVLRGTNLQCYRSPGEAEAGRAAAANISVNKDTRIRATGADTSGGSNCISISNRVGAEEVTHRLAADSQQQMHRWMEVFWQLFYDMSAWRHCCNELMRVETPSPRRRLVPVPRTGAALYRETVIDAQEDSGRIPAPAGGQRQVPVAPRPAGLEVPCRGEPGTRLERRLVSGHGRCRDWVQSQSFPLVPGDGTPVSPDRRHRTRSLDGRLAGGEAPVERRDRSPGPGVWTIHPPPPWTHPRPNTHTDRRQTQV